MVHQSLVCPHVPSPSIELKTAGRASHLCDDQLAPRLLAPGKWSPWLNSQTPCKHISMVDGLAQADLVQLSRVGLAYSLAVLFVHPATADLGRRRTQGPVHIYNGELLAGAPTWT